MPSIRPPDCAVFFIDRLHAQRAATRHQQFQSGAGQCLARGIFRAQLAADGRSVEAFQQGRVDGQRAAALSGDLAQGVAECAGGDIEVL
ncbi:hypothetical protein ACFS3C_08655 [Azotobacter vinelandii]